MEKIRTALAWARDNRRAVLAVTALAAAMAAHYVPGLPKDQILNALAVLLGA